MLLNMSNLKKIIAIGSIGYITSNSLKKKKNYRIIKSCENSFDETPIKGLSSLDENCINIFENVKIMMPDGGIVTDSNFNSSPTLIPAWSNDSISQPKFVNYLRRSINKSTA